MAYGPAVSQARGEALSKRPTPLRDIYGHNVKGQYGNLWEAGFFHTEERGEVSDMGPKAFGKVAGPSHFLPRP